MEDRVNLLLVFMIGLLAGSLAMWAFYAPKLGAASRKAVALENSVSELNSTVSALTVKLAHLEKEKLALEERLAAAEENSSRLAWELKKALAALAAANARLRLLEDSVVSVKPLPDRDYYPEVKRLISSANSSVHVAVFAVKYDPFQGYEDPVDQLLHGLVEAKERGVDVRVLVDDVTYREYYDTIRYLKEHGVRVRLDSSSERTMHAKIVVIDGKVAVVGSHNWTESALRWNNEYSVELVGAKAASAVERYFEELWDNGRRV